MRPLPTIAKPVLTRTASVTSKTPAIALFLLFSSSMSYVHADGMSALIAQKSAQVELAAPSAVVSTRLTIQRQTQPNYQYNNESATSYRYPEIQRQTPTLLPTFLSGSYDNVDSKYLSLLERAETQSSPAAREVMSAARIMTLNERMIIQGGCWDYLNAVFKRAGVTRDTVHKGAYRQGPYANSSDIQVGDWLYYINHGYRGIEHSGMFVGWVDESAKQALILSYAGESRREPARYKVYDLSNVYQIMRPTI